MSNRGSLIPGNVFVIDGMLFPTVSRTGGLGVARRLTETLSGCPEDTKTGDDGEGSRSCKRSWHVMRCRGLRAGMPHSPTRGPSPGRDEPEGPEGGPSGGHRLCRSRPPPGGSGPKTRDTSLCDNLVHVSLLPKDSKFRKSRGHACLLHCYVSSAWHIVNDQ